MGGPAGTANGFVSRGQPQPAPDFTYREQRIGRYGDTFAINLYNKNHGLSDEGSYRMANSGSQTGIIANGASAFSATAPSLIIYNNDQPSNPSAKRIYLDYLNLVTTVVGSAASGLVNLQAALYTDVGNRYSSAGTNITGNVENPNMDSSMPTIASVYFGAIVAAAATGAVRALCPLRVIRPAVSGTVLDVVGETKLFNFGPVEGTLNGSITIANANFIPVPLPPVIIGPNQCMLLYLWQNNGATNVAATYAPELAWWER